MSKFERELLNQFIVSRFSNLHHMYKLAKEEAHQERVAQLRSDWQEWAELDEESKQFVLGYLSQEECGSSDLISPLA